MNEDDIRTLTTMQKQLDEERIRRMTIENNFNENNSNNQDNKNDKNIIELQLDLKEELDKIYHLLRGDIIERDSEGNERWIEPDDDRLKILSDYGVKQIMNIIYFYINKNTLLSNYSEQMIFWKVRDFGIELSDLIYNRYEHFFSYPTPEELFELYRPRLNNHLNITEEQLYEKCIQWSKEELQSKLRHFPMIVLALVDSVHSTFLRAMNAGERISIRKQVNVHENLSNQTGQFDQRVSKSLFRPTTWKN